MLIINKITKISLLFLIFLFCYVNGNSQTSITNLSGKFETSKVSVLMIYTARDTNVSQGSAFLIANEGMAISNYHVFKNKDEAIAIDYKGKKYEKISIIYANEDLDYIVFRIHGIKLPPLKIAKMQPPIGEPCFAIGNPLGYDQTLSTGIISGYRDNDNYIQTSAEITHGSSGGPLFNNDAEVIGITTSGAGTANLNFAVNLLKIDLDFIKNRVSAYPDQIVKQFLKNLGSQQFNNAYALSDNPLWDNNGGLQWFASNHAYGGIKSVNINEVRVESNNSSNAIVFAHYYAEDPIHSSKDWEQYYYLEKKQNGWVIVKVKLK
jgi:Trypsin-like peptidase domain